MFGGKLLSKESLSKMTTPYKNGYALGLMTGNRNGHKVIQHGGGIQGFNTQLAYYPDNKLTVREKCPYLQKQRTYSSPKWWTPQSNFSRIIRGL
ncbi:MAG: hypothetical protein JW925_05555 [Syntrophaceae bacterium]|nr:hypothetical protein [Syntrophaceae bacterium]